MPLPSLLKMPSEYVALAIDAMAARGSTVTDFNTGSAARNLFESIAAMLSAHSAVADQHRLDSYLSTATGDALTLKAADLGVDRKVAVQATGTVRITRSSTTTAQSIPAGWSPLSTVPRPGVPPVTYVTLEDAVLPIGTGAVVVAARAVDGGVAGNIAQGSTSSTLLLPINPVGGFQTDSDFVAYGPFTDGVDAETDDQLRKRVPIDVQGRVKGRASAFLAAALSVAGVTSAQVRQAGDSRVGGTVGAGEVYVYYEGSASLLGTVTNACGQASILDQNVTVATAAGIPMTITLTVFVQAGTDHAAVTAAVKTALLNLVETYGVGGLARVSQAVQAVHGVAAVQSMTIPFADFRKTTGDASGVCHDVDPSVGKVVTLDASAIAVTVTDLA